MEKQKDVWVDAIEIAGVVEKKEEQEEAVELSTYRGEDRRYITEAAIADANTKDELSHLLAYVPDLSFKVDKV